MDKNKIFVPRHKSCSRFSEKNAFYVETQHENAIADKHFHFYYNI